MGVRGTEAGKGPWCREPGVCAGNYTGTLEGVPLCSLKARSTCKLGEILPAERVFPGGELGM